MKWASIPCGHQKNERSYHICFKFKLPMLHSLKQHAQKVLQVLVPSIFHTFIQEIKKDSSIKHNCQHWKISCTCPQVQFFFPTGLILPSSPMNPMQFHCFFHGRKNGTGLRARPGHKALESHCSFALYSVQVHTSTWSGGWEWNLSFCAYSWCKWLARWPWWRSSPKKAF